MASRSSVALAATVHQPTDRLVPLCQVHVPALVASYAAVSAYCSAQTHPTIISILEQHGVRVTRGSGPPSGIDGIGMVRRETIRAGLQTGLPYLQMGDFDRILHWMGSFPRELELVIAELPRYDFLVLGRTERAWATHPAYQAQTEPLFNRVFCQVSGQPWDVGAGSRGLSRRAALALLDLSREATVGVDAEWPLLLLRRDGFCVGYRPCEGLEFETADRYGPEIEALGGYEQWAAHMSASPEQWILRLRIALLIAESAVRYGTDGAHNDW